MTLEAYADAFWHCFLILALLAIFYIGLRDDKRRAPKRPDPTPLEPDYKVRRVDQ